MKFGSVFRLCGGPLLCLHGALLFAQEEPAANPNSGAAGVQAVAPSEGATAVIEVEASEAPAAIAAHAVQPVPTLVVFSDDGGPGLGSGVGGAAQVPTEAHSRFWIGLICNLPGDALRVQLDLPAETGLLVEEVTDGGPAMKAGILKHDVLLSTTITSKADAQAVPLKRLEDLVNQIRTAEATPVRFELLRRGRKQVLQVVPEERPSLPPQPVPMVTRLNDNQVLRLFTDAPATTSVRARWAGPMIVPVVPPLPEGVTIDYQTGKGQPDKLHVKRGDQTWDLSVAGLDKLPEDLSPVLDKIPEDLRPIVSQYVAAKRAAATARMTVVRGIAAGGAVPNTPVAVYASGLVLPDDTTITIVRHGAEPAKVNVKKGDQSWDATDKDLSSLPAEIRRLVDMSLNGHWRARAVEMVKPGVQAVRYITPDAAKPPAIVYPTVEVQPPVNQAAQPSNRDEASARERRAGRSIQPAPRDIESQLRELAEKVEELRQAVEKSKLRQ